MLHSSSCVAVAGLELQNAVLLYAAWSPSNLKGH